MLKPSDMLTRWVESQLSEDPKVRRTASAAAANAFPTGVLDIRASRLNFDALKAKDPTLTVRAGMGGLINVSTKRIPLVADGINRLQTEHPAHKLIMTEDILSYEPDEDLIFMSVNPIWIVQPKDDFAVSIKRVH